jgi:6,7-dimethyl-8-ribityllumazine synthase
MSRFIGTIRATPDQRYAIVQSRFNQSVTDALTAGAVDMLTRHGVPADHIDIVVVPGALEIPFAVRRLLPRGYAAVICLGAVVRGETPHFDFVSQHSIAQITALGALGQVPVVMGVLTCDTMEQARDRAGGKAGNKGADAAVTALEMANLAQQLPLIPADEG